MLFRSEELRRLKKRRDSLSPLQVLPQLDLQLPGWALAEKVKGLLEEVRSFQGKLLKESLRQQELSDLLSSKEREWKEVVEEVATLLGDLKECPTCGSPMEASFHG